MECDVCATRSFGDPGMHCPACARASIYPLRVRHAKLLIDKERASRKVQQVVDVGKKVENQRKEEESQRAESRIEAIVQKSNELRLKVEEYKKDIERRKAATKHRRTAHESATTQLNATRSGILEPLKKAVRKGGHRYDSQYNHIVAARVFLCKEAADLVGLSSSGSQEGYAMHNLKIVDLRDLNNSSPQHITSTLTNVARILVHICFYLDIRLPAEINLPRENHPLPTIYAPSSSYLLETSSIAASVEESTSSRPRPLHLDRRLTDLAREDPTRYYLFVEGVSLLAWNLAWLCRSQGISVADSDWTDVCNMGRNLYLLLVEEPKRPRPSKRETLTSAFGVRSHGSSHSFLASITSVPSNGVDVLPRSWRFANPMSVTVKLRAYLLTDMSGEGWEILEEAPMIPELEADIGVGGEPSSTTATSSERGGGNRSEGEEDPVARVKGWTKLKSRAPPL